MPKVKITEVDNTGRLQLSPITNVIYIPGKAGTKMEKPVLCSTISDLENLMQKEGLIDDLSYKLAYRCLQLGMQVLYQGFEGSSAKTSWSKGNYFANIVEDSETHELKVTISGEEFIYDAENSKLITVKEYGPEGEEAPLEFAITGGVCVLEGEGLQYLKFNSIKDEEKQQQYETIKFDYINNKVGYDWLGVDGGDGIEILASDWDALSDKALYNIRFLTSGAYPQDYSDMIKCATKRGDCVALLDHSPNSRDVASIREVFEAIEDSDVAPKLEKKFAAAFTPWWTSNVEEFGDALIPPSFAYLFAYARSIKSNPDWFAVAGSFRGIIPELKDVEKKYTSAEIEMLQGRAANAEVELDGVGDNVGLAINPIAYIDTEGYLIWGNRTLIVNKANSQSVGVTSASSFLNVRQISIDIVKTLYAAARKYTFEQNSNTLWLNFKHEVQPLLDRMVSGNGIVTYTIDQVPTTAKARLCAKISITPIEGVEDFELELYLEDSLQVIE